jgi:hypothetical protein
MSYRIIATATDEIVSEVTSEYIAVRIADNLAKKSDFQESFAVYELVLRYETDLTTLKAEMNDARQDEE